MFSSQISSKIILDVYRLDFKRFVNILSECNCDWRIFKFFIIFYNNSLTLIPNICIDSIKKLHLSNLSLL